MTRSPSIAVIGAGAAGTMAAIFAASAGAETTLVERMRDGGRKILISGGGRCNILPAAEDETRFVTDSPRTVLRRMLRSWPLREQTAFFENEAGIPLVCEQESGKLFPASNSARDVRDRLLALARRRGARIATGARVTGVAPDGGRWRIDIAGADAILADAVILATGGLSVPNTGSDGDGLGFARRLGLAMHPTYPALTPLLAQPAPYSSLSGVSLDVAIAARGGEWNARARGGFLFTHRGYSGPAVLDVSHVVARAGGATTARVAVQWTGLDADAWERRFLQKERRTVLGAIRHEMPERLATALLDDAGIDESRPLAQLTRAERKKLVEALTRFELPVTGHDGYRSAEVTGGGVALDAVDPRTMECLKRPGLFLCGELLDAFGPVGGFNFQWAWATGRAAGMGAGMVKRGV